MESLHVDSSLPSANLAKTSEKTSSDVSLEQAIISKIRADFEDVHKDACQRWENLQDSLQWLHRVNLGLDECYLMTIFYLWSDSRFKGKSRKWREDALKQFEENRQLTRKCILDSFPGVNDLDMFMVALADFIAVQRQAERSSLDPLFLQAFLSPIDSYLLEIPDPVPEHPSPLLDRDESAQSFLNRSRAETAPDDAIYISFLPNPAMMLARREGRQASARPALEPIPVGLEFTTDTSEFWVLPDELYVHEQLGIRRSRVAARVTVGKSIQWEEDIDPRLPQDSVSALLSSNNCASLLDRLQIPSKEVDLKGKARHLNFLLGISQANTWESPRVLDSWFDQAYPSSRPAIPTNPQPTPAIFGWLSPRLGVYVMRALKNPLKAIRRRRHQIEYDSALDSSSSGTENTSENNAEGSLDEIDAPSPIGDLPLSDIINASHNDLDGPGSSGGSNTLPRTQGAPDQGLGITGVNTDPHLSNKIHVAPTNAADSGQTNGSQSSIEAPSLALLLEKLPEVRAEVAEVWAGMMNPATTNESNKIAVQTWKDVVSVLDRIQTDIAGMRQYASEMANGPTPKSRLRRMIDRKRKPTSEPGPSTPRSPESAPRSHRPTKQLKMGETSDAPIESGSSGGPSLMAKMANAAKIWKGKQAARSDAM